MSDAIIISTEWDEFKSFDWNHIYDLMKKPAWIFDGRNLLDSIALEKLGFKIYSIGKSASNLHLMNKKKLINIFY